DMLIARLKDIAVGEGIVKASELRGKFAEMIEDSLFSVNGTGAPIKFSHDKPCVVILIGVNGSGKTTTAAKLALQLKNAGKSVIMAAADTFRAAAIDQLKIWGERTGVRVIAQKQDSDPAAVVYDAIMAGKASSADVIIVDTAGRLHTKSNLMEELAKVYRIVKRKLPEEPSEVFIVLDSVTGQNSFAQAEAFAKVMPSTGVILTKFDNTSKGGIALSIVEKLKLPVRYIGLGEGLDDLELFDPKTFAGALLDDGR
ncbi:MAG: signal recognition particle-docking protein FtsY, partial [Synergistaceae bacterium]|nr:signal recognition particle-docking protein FtsY [Synergistaceae bacterium]